MQLPLPVLAAVALLVPAAARLRRGSNNHGDAAEVQIQLGTMMRDANERLERVEAHHERLVQQTRADIAHDFNHRAETLGRALLRYESRLIGAQIHLEAMINVTKEALGKAIKASEAGGALSWDDPNSVLKATLTAKLGKADTNLRSMRRDMEQQIKHFEEAAQEPLEEEQQRLEVKVGDLSPQVALAKQRISAVLAAAEASGNLTRDAAKGVKPAELPRTKGSEKARLTALADGIDAAMKTSKMEADQASAALEAVIQSETVDTKAKAASLLDQMTDAEKTEVGIVTGHSALHVSAIKKAAPKEAAASMAKKA